MAQTSVRRYRAQLRENHVCFVLAELLNLSFLVLLRLLVTLSSWTGGVMLCLWIIVCRDARLASGSAKKLLGNIRDRDLSRAYGYQMPKLFDDLPEGTVVLNVAKHTWKYPLLGARLKNRVIDAGERGWHPPFSQSQLDAEAVEVVFFRGSCPSFFADDVASEKIFDDTEDPNRLPTTIPTRVYRILRSESSRYHPQSS